MSAPLLVASKVVVGYVSIVEIEIDRVRSRCIGIPAAPRAYAQVAELMISILEICTQSLKELAGRGKPWRVL